MNKQELIEKIKANGEWFETNRYVKITKAIEFIKQLDEPQKVKVPAFVAEKMKRYKSALCMLSSEYFDTSLEVDSDELANWIDQNSEKFFHAWLDGYEVEEEPRYRLVLPHVSKMVHGHATKIHNMKTKETKDLAYDTFTEQEIKAIDERYWPFAVPIEKVEE